MHPVCTLELTNSNVTGGGPTSRCMRQYHTKIFNVTHPPYTSSLILETKIQLLPARLQYPSHNEVISKCILYPSYVGGIWLGSPSSPPIAFGTTLVKKQ